jgi:Fe2+ or Zn2+ uptake regulation protein
VTTAPERTSAERVEEVLTLLRARGGRVTTARRQLLEALFASAGHRTAEDLTAEIQARAPDIHLSTIYRNLDELERLGVIVHTHLGHGPASYHLSSSAHGHLVCERCGLTLEAPRELFASLSKGAEARFGFHIDPRHFAVLGRCTDCSASSRRPSSSDE